MAKREDKSQIDKFREAARELKTDQSDDAVNKIAHAPKLTHEQIEELVRRKHRDKKG
ncbi:MULTISPECIES: hypothetical protein [unclassified Mesorhizobium]|uniref:hypothetical protein n=1 Tax=unclassified Mesorhizobium TaxID=325217 RepID=UPI00257D15F0|nr:hypothetical protein [Mesorhizobium sp.]